MLMFSSVVFRKEIKMEIKNKHLTYENRQYLENGLSKSRKYTDIAIDLNFHKFITTFAILGIYFLIQPIV